MTRADVLRFLCAHLIKHFMRIHILYQCLSRASKHLHSFLVPFLKIIIIVKTRIKVTPFYSDTSQPCL